MKTILADKAKNHLSRVFEIRKQNIAGEHLSAHTLNIPLISPPGTGKTAALMDIAVSVLDKSLFKEFCIHLVVYITPCSEVPLPLHREHYDNSTCGGPTFPFGKSKKRGTLVMVYFPNDTGTFSYSTLMSNERHIHIDHSGDMLDALSDLCGQNEYNCNKATKDGKCICLRLYDPTSHCPIPLYFMPVTFPDVEWISIDAVSGGFIRDESSSTGSGDSQKRIILRKNAVMIPLWSKDELILMFRKTFALYANTTAVIEDVVDKCLLLLGGRPRPIFDSMAGKHILCSAPQLRTHAFKELNEWADCLISDVNRLESFVEFVLTNGVTTGVAPVSEAGIGDRNKRSDQLIVPGECLDPQSPFADRENTRLSNAEIKFCFATSYISRRVIEKVGKGVFRTLLHKLLEIDGLLFEFAVLRALTGRDVEQPWAACLANKKIYNWLESTSESSSLPFPSIYNSTNCHEKVHFTMPTNPGESERQYTITFPSEIVHGRIYQFAATHPEIDAFLVFEKDGQTNLFMLQVTRNLNGHKCNPPLMVNLRNQIITRLGNDSSVNIRVYLLYCWCCSEFKNFKLTCDGKKIQEHHLNLLSDKEKFEGVYIIDMSPLNRPIMLQPISDDNGVASPPVPSPVTNSDMSPPNRPIMPQLISDDNGVASPPVPSPVTTPGSKKRKTSRNK